MAAVSARSSTVFSAPLNTRFEHSRTPVLRSLPTISHCFACCLRMAANERCAKRRRRLFAIFMTVRQAYDILLSLVTTTLSSLGQFGYPTPGRRHFGWRTRRGETPAAKHMPSHSGNKFSWAADASMPLFYRSPRVLVCASNGRADLVFHTRSLPLELRPLNGGNDVTGLRGTLTFMPEPYLLLLASDLAVFCCPRHSSAARSHAPTHRCTIRTTGPWTVSRALPSLPCSFFHRALLHYDLPLRTCAISRHSSPSHRAASPLC